MNEKIEYKGYWWLPDNPDETVAGVLTYTPHEEIMLELIGEFGSKEGYPFILKGLETESIIYGLTSENKVITLITCHPSANVKNCCPFPITTFDCQFLLIGKHLEDYKKTCFFKAHVKIPALSHWCLPSLIEKSDRYDKEDNIESTSISFTKERIINNIHVNEVTNVILKESIDYHGGYFSSQLEQNTFLEIRKKEGSISDFYSDIYLYEQFLSLATLLTVRCSEVSLYDKTVFRESKNGERNYPPIKLIYVQRNYKEVSKFKSFYFLFNYTSIAQHYPKIIHKWYAEKDNIAPIREHLIDSISHKRVYSSVDYLIVIQAVEGFWWRFRDHNYRERNKIPPRKQTDLKIIIKELLKEFDSIGKTKKMDLDIGAVVDSRHYYSHFMNKSQKPETLDGWELFDLTFKLRVLLISCLLNFVGFDNALINDVFNKSNNYWLQG